MDEPDVGRTEAVREELNEFDTDLAMQRENRDLRAARVVATVEMSVYYEVSEHLRSQGLRDLANHYATKAENAEVRSSLKGHD